MYVGNPTPKYLKNKNKFLRVTVNLPAGRQGSLFRETMTIFVFKTCSWKVQKSFKRNPLTLYPAYRQAGRLAS